MAALPAQAHSTAPERVPLALAQLHPRIDVDAPVELTFSARWQPALLAHVVAGAGFAIDVIDERGPLLFVRGRRLRTLPDTVGPGMRLLACGLNPSIYAADVGVGFARPGNRFWPAALAAGLVSRPRDPVHALVHHGMGMTDLVKRATARADALQPEEYRTGLARVERIVEWLRPAAVCMVGLTGWRAAVDARAVAGPQPRRLAGAPVYVMPSTSGANAHAQLPDLVEHLRAALTVGDATAIVTRSRPRSARSPRRGTPPARRAR